MRKDYLVSIFMPVYNGERYLNNSLLSVINQTYSNVEILLVDDSSTDNSYEILNDFALNDNRIKVFKKENGGMVPISLNFIKPFLKGDFFYYLSQDDILSLDLIENMVDRQKETNADTVLPDMEFYFEGRKCNKKIAGLNSDRSIILSGKEALIESLEWHIHGFALFRTNLIKSVVLYEDAFDADEYFTRELFLKSNKVVFCKGTFFYRQGNIDAITKTFSMKNFYVLTTLKRLYDLLKNNEIDKKYIFDTQFKILKLYLKLISIYSVYSFSSKKDKKEVGFYLSCFKNVNFNTAFYLENFYYAIKKAKFKFLLFLILFRISFLFYFLRKIYSKKYKRQFLLN